MKWLLLNIKWQIDLIQSFSVTNEINSNMMLYCIWIFCIYHNSSYNYSLFKFFWPVKEKVVTKSNNIKEKKWSQSRIIISTLIYLTYLAILWSSPAWLYCINPGCFLCSGMIYNSIPCSVRLLQPSTQQPPRLLWFGKLYLIKNL